MRYVAILKKCGMAEVCTPVLTWKCTVLDDAPRLAASSPSLSFSLFPLTTFHFFSLLTSFFEAHTYSCVHAHVPACVCMCMDVSLGRDTQGWYPSLSTLVTEVGVSHWSQNGGVSRWSQNSLVLSSLSSQRHPGIPHLDLLVVKFSWISMAFTFPWFVKTFNFFIMYVCTGVCKVLLGSMEVRGTPGEVKQVIASHTAWAKTLEHGSLWEKQEL